MNVPQHAGGQAGGRECVQDSLIQCRLDDWLLHLGAWERQPPFSGQWLFKKSDLSGKRAEEAFREVDTPANLLY